jgi:ADP-heptose:LPS heptosyltransferase
MKAPIKKVLVISLSNIGDIILTFPVIDILKRDFPDARLDFVIGPKGETLVKGNPAFGKIYLYHKKQPPLIMMKWMKELACEKYDLVVDLRNSAIPFLIFAKEKTPIMFSRAKTDHMRQQHLSRLSAVHEFTGIASRTISFEKEIVSFPDGKYVVVAPGSRAENKRWHEDGFAKIADYLIERYGLKVVFAGDDNDVQLVARVTSLMKQSALDLTGKLSLAQLGLLMSKASLAVVNDSAPLHLASYLNIPVAAFFGPTDPQKYGPWSDRNIVIRKNLNCPACAGEKSVLHNCTQAISFQDAIAVLEPWFKETLSGQ